IEPLLFAFQTALAETLRAWGTEPDAIVGHSTGEVAAAHVAGVLDLEAAAHVVHHYSRAQASAYGKMAQVAVPAAEVAALIEPHAGRVEIAAMNGRRLTVISGEAEPVLALVDAWRARGITSHMVRMDAAAHSPIMAAPLLEELQEALRDQKPQRAHIPLWS